MAGCIILSIGAILQATAFGIPQMIVGRIVAGVGNGLNTSTIRMLLFPGFTSQLMNAAVWHSELSKASSRGKGVSLPLYLLVFHANSLACYRAGYQHLWRYDSLLGWYVVEYLTSGHC